MQTSPVLTVTPGAPVPTTASPTLTPTRATERSSGPSSAVSREASITTPSLLVSMARARLPAMAVSSSAIGSDAASISARFLVSTVEMRSLLMGSKLIFSPGLRPALRQRFHDWITGSGTRPEGRSPCSK